METLAPARPVTRRPRISLWALRVVITVNLLAVLAQPVLAGLFLTGDVDAIGVHGVIGSLLAVIELVVIVIAVAYVLGGRGRLWVLPVAVLLFLAVGFQIGAGYARELELHVPLGVTIVVASVLLAGWAWTPSAARPRTPR
ncbi:hypothetical protein [Pseudonocardia alaniniphila]|uniref:Integral membrane protein n=1 Tax=Pseudonocardia alaniniphila TaxID=75291 RepID=A0ABS9TK94_9PSEU|nr:hypothetical protein [Pseudonocardia alaniniphila]MCH6168962.1 hypothetical protein [Pseudonocardia alaniniphila]